MTGPSTQVALKAIAYLTNGRVRIDYADDRLVAATVRGSQPKPYDVDHMADEWRCTCPAGQLNRQRGRGAQCSHILAVAAVWQPVAAALHAV